MQLKLDALDTHLAKGLKGLYVVYGDEHLLAQEACDRIRAKARASGFTDRSVFVVDRYFDWSTLLGASQSMSLFGDRQLVELRIPHWQAGQGRRGGAENPRRRQPRRPHADHPSAPGFGHAENRVVHGDHDLGRGLEGRPCRARAIAGVDRPAAGGAGPSGWLRATMGGRRCNSSRNAWRATCSPRTRRSRSSACLHPAGVLTAGQIHDAVLNVARYDVFKLNEAMLAAMSGAWHACSMVSRARAKRPCWCCGRWSRKCGPCFGSSAAWRRGSRLPP